MLQFEDEAHEYWNSIADTVKSQDEHSINVWFIPRDLLVALEALYGDVLCSEERTRFESIRIKGKSIARLGARVLLRRILSIYLDCQSADLAFTYTSFGKPLVTDEGGVERVYFSVSHTRDGSLVSMSPRVPHAVDIETPRELSDLDSLKYSVLADSELADLEKQSSANKTLRFFEYWTCKESILKLHGCGLSVNLKAVAIAFNSSGEPSVVAYPKTFNATETSELLVWKNESWISESWIGAIASPKVAKSIRLLSPFPRLE